MQSFNPSPAMRPRKWDLRPLRFAGKWHDMITLVCAASKGGVGKTSFCANLAVAAEEAGSGPVAILDTDPQQSLHSWWQLRKVDKPGFCGIRVGLGPTLAALAETGIALAIVDTPPRLDGPVPEAVRLATFVLIPCQPSMLDLGAIGGVIDLAARKPRRPLAFVINRVWGDTKRGLPADAAIALSQHGTVAPVQVGNRVVFSQSMIDGRSAIEVEPGGKGAAEIRELWSYLAKRIATEVENGG
jgi:chromosome partitioning protein